jgi:hypothetical protein
MADGEEAPPPTVTARDDRRRPEMPKRDQPYPTELTPASLYQRGNLAGNELLWPPRRHLLWRLSRRLCRQFRPTARPHWAGTWWKAKAASVTMPILSPHAIPALHPHYLRMAATSFRIMDDIARNRHTGGFAHILVDSLPVASRIPGPTCIRKYLGTHELAPLGSLSVLGLGLALRGLSRHTGICWCPSIPNHSL